MYRGTTTTALLLLRSKVNLYSDSRCTGAMFFLNWSDRGVGLARCGMRKSAWKVVKSEYNAVKSAVYIMCFKKI